MKGPAIFLAQFMRDEEPYNSIENIGRWVAGLGYKGVQIPAWDERVINLDQAAISKTYCDDFKGKLTGVKAPVRPIIPRVEGNIEGSKPAMTQMPQSITMEMATPQRV